MQVSSLVLYALDVEQTAGFYRLLGVDMRQVDGRAVGHADGCRIAIVRAATAEVAPPNSSGTTMIGFETGDLTGLMDRLRGERRRVLRPPETLSWGRRAVVADPDGRAVELVQKD